MTNNNEVLEGNEGLTPSSVSFSFSQAQKYVDQYIQAKLDENVDYFSQSQWYYEDISRYLRVSGEKNIADIFKQQQNKKDFVENCEKRIQYENIKVQELLRTLKTISFKDYNFDVDENKKLDVVLKKQSIKGLYDLLRTQGKRNVFLVKQGILSQQELEKRIDGISKEEEKTLKKIFSHDTQIIQKLSQETNKDLLYAIFSIYNLHAPVYVSDLEKIFQTDLFSPDHKKMLIEYFLPVISLNIVKKYGLLSSTEIENQLLDIAQRYHIDTTHQATFDDFKEKLDDKNIFISTQSLHHHAFQFDNKSGVILEGIAQEINQAKQSFDTVDVLGEKDFLSYIQASKKLSLEFKQEIVKNFQQGNYIRIRSIDSQEKEIETYFYIDTINTTSVALTNVTKVTGISATNKGKTNIHTFQELFDLFLNVSEDKTKSISLLQKTDLYTKSGDEVKRVPENNEIHSRKDLENALNEIDPAGQHIPLEKMAFSYPKSASDAGNIFQENFHTVTYDPNENALKLDTGEIFAGSDLTVFLELFQERGCKRFQKLDTVDDFIQEANTKIGAFKDVEIKEGKFIPKDQKDSHHPTGIELLIGKSQDQDGTIRINKIENGYIDFSLGTYKEGSKPGEVGVFKEDKRAAHWSYTSFLQFIKSKNYTPKQEQPHEDHHEDHHGAHMHQHSNFFGAWMGWWSITEIVKGAHQMIHTIEHSLETGNKVKAAKAALMFGKFLPMHLRVELQSEVENSEKETMEKIKKELTGVDSKVMFPMIVHILQDKSAPQYEIEAAMFATLKYGSLYPKDLAQYRGSYAWFEKLGGKKSMIPSLTQEALKEDPNLVVTEEVLINSLLAQQAMGLISPKRRSKIHKEFGATIQEGLSKEAGDGERETGLRMTADGRISYIMGEFKGSTFANGIGGMENVWAKGPDPAWKMNTIPFVIMASGLSLDLHQSLINKLKKFGYTTPYNSLSLAASQKGVQMYQKYLDKVIELYSGGVTTQMYQDFQKAKKGSDSGKTALSMKGFWDKYGSTLYPVINMNDGYVISKKDEPGNEVLDAYYSHIKGMHNSTDFVAKNDHIEEGFYDANNSPVAQTGSLLYKIVPKDRGGFLDGVAKTILYSHLDYIQNIVDNPQISDEKRKEIFSQSYKTIERYLYEKMVSAVNPKEGDNEWFKNLEIYRELQKKGFTIYNTILKDPNNPIEVKKFDAGYDAFLDEEWKKFQTRTHQNPQNLSGIKNRFESSIEDILHLPSQANDDQYKEIA